MFWDSSSAPHLKTTYMIEPVELQCKVPSVGQDFGVAHKHAVDTFAVDKNVVSKVFVC